MESLDGLAMEEMATLLHSLTTKTLTTKRKNEPVVSQTSKPKAESTDNHRLLIEALAQIPFFANLPPDVMSICASEPLAVRQISRDPKENKAVVLYKQGDKLDANAGLFVIGSGEVGLHSNSRGDGSQQTPDNFGNEFVRLQSGDAFGDEILYCFASDDRRNSDSDQIFSVTRSSSAVVPQSALLIHLTNKRALGAIAAWLVAQPSMLFHLHPRLCLEALRKAPCQRDSTELVRVAQCLDAVGAFSSHAAKGTGFQVDVASNADFADFTTGQHVFLEGTDIDACHILVYGKVVLCQVGAPPDASQPPNPTSQLGHVVDELCAGDVLVDPAPWFRGFWPCSAVASTRAGILRLPQSTYLSVQLAGAAFKSRQFVQLLRKPPSARKRFENDRVAQFLSAFGSMHEVAMDKRSELAGLMSVARYDSGKHISVKANEEQITLTGHAREVGKVISSDSRTNWKEGERTGVDAISDSSVQLELDWLQGFIGRCFSLHWIVKMLMDQELKTWMTRLCEVEGQTDTGAMRASFLAKVAPFICSFEVLLLESSLRSLSRCSTQERHGQVNADLLHPGDVLGWHVFPGTKQREGKTFRVIIPTEVAVLSHADVGGVGSKGKALIFRRGSAYIQTKWRSKVIDALHFLPSCRSPEDISSTQMVLQNIPPFSFLRRTQPAAFKLACAEAVLHHLQPGNIVCSQGDRVEHIYIVLNGTLNSIVSSHKLDLAATRSSTGVLARSFRSSIRASRPQSAAFSSRRPQSAAKPVDDDESGWARSKECIAVYGVGDCVGFADMLDDTWRIALVAGHTGCSLAAIPTRVLRPHCELLISSISSTVSPGSCSTASSVPRKFLTRESLLMLQMVLASSPSFRGLSQRHVAKLCDKALCMSLSSHQIFSIQGEDSEHYALVMKGTMASYSGLQDAVRALVAPQVGCYIDSKPLQDFAARSLTRPLHRLVHSTDSSLEGEGLWLENTFDLDIDGNLSYREGQTSVVVGNIKCDLSDLQASPALLTQCKLKVDGTSGSQLQKFSSGFARFHRSSITSKRSSLISKISNRPSSGDHARGKLMENAPIGAHVKVGQASNRLALHFGKFAMTLFCSDSEALCDWLLCLVCHWISGNDHPLGNLVKTVAAESEVGSGILEASRLRIGCSSTHENTSSHGERPATASSVRSAGKRQSIVQSNSIGRRSSSSRRNTVVGHKPVPRPSTAGLSVEMSSNAMGTYGEDGAKNTSSIMTIEPCELVVLSKTDVKQAMLELRVDDFFSLLKSLGQQGLSLATDIEEHSPHLLPHIGELLEPRKFEATQFLFHAGKRAEEIFLLIQGQCSLQYPVAARAPGQKEELAGRPMPPMRGQKKSEILIGVSHVQAPCFLGLHNNYASKCEYEKGEKQSPHNVYGMSAQAVGSVEVYVLKMSPNLDSNIPELKARFLDKFVECLEQLALVHQEGLSKMRVAHTRIEMRPQGHFASENSTIPKNTSRTHQEAMNANLMGIASSSRIRGRVCSWTCHETIGSLQLAAADVGSIDWRTCLEAGITEKAYRVWCVCPSCMRLTYPEDGPTCSHCGMQCVNRARQPTMAADAESTLEHLQHVRDQKRELDFSPSPKPGMRQEQLDSALANVMSRSDLRLSLSSHQMGSASMHHDVECDESLLDLGNSLGGQQMLGHNQQEDAELSEIHVTSTGHVQGIGWDANTKSSHIDEIQDAPYPHENEFPSSTQCPIGDFHPCDMAGMANEDDALPDHGYNEWPSELPMSLSSLRPRTSDGTIHLDIEGTDRARRGLKSRDGTRRSVALVARPMSSGPWLGNSSCSSAFMTVGMDIVARDKKISTRNTTRTKSTCTLRSGSSLDQPRLRASSALANPFSSKSSSSATTYFPSHERPQTSPVSQNTFSRASTTEIIPHATYDAATQPESFSVHLTMHGLPGSAWHETSRDGSRHSSSMQRYVAHQQQGCCKDLDESLSSDSHIQMGRRYEHVISASLRHNACFLLDPGHNQQRADVGEDIQNRYKFPPKSGPSPFLVCSATRSQVTLRRSAPKYRRLAKLNFDCQGDVF